MPKASSSTFNHAHNNGGPQNAHVLRRNQACHQCRKRKLKCDAKKPCSTCIRSHAYALQHAPPGARMPPHPECTFDVLPDIPALDQQDPPKSRFEKLETRISELEALLSEKNGMPGPPSGLRTSQMDPGPSRTNSSLSNGNGSVGVNFSVIDPALTGGHADDSMIGLYPQTPNGCDLDRLAEAAMLVETKSNGYTVNGQGASGQISSGRPRSDPVLEIMQLGWPKNLPSPDLLRHLVDAYFSFNPDANRMFHRSTFLATLTFPPTHPRFPMTALLHAMCAIGSMYTAAIAPTPHPTSSPHAIDDPFDMKHKVSERRPDSFAEMHAQFARQAVDAAHEMGENLFQSLQTEVLLSYWYWASAKWSEAFLSTSRSLRSSVPLGLNISSSFSSMSDSLRPPCIIAPPKNAIEDEIRRNTFWIAYALERTLGCGHGWALMLDDQDVSQLLPMPLERYEQHTNNILPTRDRQWSHERNVLLIHPDGQTDEFTLYIKSTMLLSRVKAFNSRFRAKYYAGDPSTVTYYGTPGGAPTKDIRHTAAFIELNQLIADFQGSFPPHLRQPVENGSVNTYLFSACTAPWLAHILLHETHAHIGSETCPSSLRILNAARGILNLVYSVYATSYDISLLGQAPVVSWFMAGRVLVRFVRAAIETNAQDLCTSLLTEVDFLRLVLSKAGDRMPLAHRYGKMLQGFIRQNCGEEYMNPVPESYPPRNEPSPDVSNTWWNVTGTTDVGTGMSRMTAMPPGALQLDESTEAVAAF